MTDLDKPLTVFHYGITVISDVPVTGVIDNGAIMWLGDELNRGIDLDWLDHVAVCQGSCAACRCEHAQGKCDCSNWPSYGGLRTGHRDDGHEYEPTGEHDGCYEGQGTILIGGWLKDKDGLYEPDLTSDYAAIVGEIYTQVVWSKHTVKCALCSPCYPGQGDIGIQGKFLAYTLPPDLLGED